MAMTSSTSPSSTLLDMAEHLSFVRSLTLGRFSKPFPDSASRNLLQDVWKERWLPFWIIRMGAARPRSTSASWARRCGS